MFRRPTVVIVGAGASKDLDFPLGDELRYQISKLLKLVRVHSGSLSAPADLLKAIRKDSRDTNTSLNEYLRVSQTIASHVLYARSIDEFIDHHKNDPVLVRTAKIAICQTILKSETDSKLFALNNSRIHYEVNHEKLDLNDVWLKQIWYMMRQDVPRGQARLLFENLTIINFNYDRSLEAFLTQALKDMHDLSEADASKIIEEAPIYHPYGMVDKLTDAPARGTPYGGNDQAQLLRISGNIRTYCESEASDQKREFEAALGKARSVVFLGFAYRQLNLELLKCQGVGSMSVFGTAHGIPEENFEGIEGRLGGVFRRTGGTLHTRLRNVKSAELLRLYEEKLIG